MPNELQPFDDEIASLLSREREDTYSAATKVRIVRRLELATVGLASGVGSSLAPKLALWRWLPKVGLAVALFGSGVVVGFAVRAPTTKAAATETISVHDVLPSGTKSTQAGSSLSVNADNGSALPTVDVQALPRAASEVSSARSVAAASASVVSPHDRSSLGDEQRLLDTARSAVARGAYSAALDSLAEHSARYPKGRLAEERELLYVQALAGAGRTDEAAARARAFEVDFPNSIFLLAVKAASPNQGP